MISKEKYTVLFSKYKDIYSGVILSDAYFDQPDSYKSYQLYLSSSDLELIQNRVCYLNHDTLYIGIYESTYIDNAEVVFLATHKYDVETKSFVVIDDIPFVADASII